MCIKVKKHMITGATNQQGRRQANITMTTTAGRIWKGSQALSPVTSILLTMAKVTDLKNVAACQVSHQVQNDASEHTYTVS